jgi:hypothetical protein
VRIVHEVIDAGIVMDNAWDITAVVAKNMGKALKTARQGLSHDQGLHARA